MPSGSQTALRPPIPSQSTSPLALHRKTPDISASTSRSIVLGEDEGEEDEDEDTDVDADEEGVLWDAQVSDPGLIRLIADPSSDGFDRPSI